jgi:NAD(P)-dependent dehydrogenase (short-subunit alcohol dehydrogenase family)
MYSNNQEFSMSKGTAIVTGAANGIGQAYAKRLAADGFDIAVADVVEATETRTIVEATGQKFFSSLIDVTSQESVNHFYETLINQMPPVSALINNAGIYPWKSFEETDYATWQKVIRVNLDGPFLMCKAFVPGMITQRYGRIVNVASTT